MEFRQSALEVFGKSDFYSAGLCYKRPKRDREESFRFDPKVKMDFKAKIK